MGTLAIFKPKAEGKVATKDQCAVSGCGKPSERHFARGKVEAALSNERILPTAGSAGLCREHYRAFKKATKEDRELDRQSWSR